MIRWVQAIVPVSYWGHLVPVIFIQGSPFPGSFEALQCSVGIESSVVSLFLTVVMSPSIVLMIAPHFLAF